MPGTLKLSFVDTHGNPINDKVNVTLQHTVLMGAGASIRDFDGSNNLQVDALDSTQGGIYRLLVEPFKYRPVSEFVKINDGKTTEDSLMFPVEPDRVRQVDFPAFAMLPQDLQTRLQNSNIDQEDIPGLKGLSGEALYQAMPDIPKAGMFNLYAKMNHTTFDNGRNVFSYIQALNKVAGDRFFAAVEAELHEKTTTSPLFHSVLDTLHTPLIGFSNVDSYKTFDHYGNLQLTFSKDEQGEFMVDADIDDAQGIEHLFQVARNAVRGPTNPYDIHEILLEDQKIDSGYVIEV
jgi:hypothetical protein